MRAEARRRSLALARASGLAVAAIGTVALIGWMWGAPGLTTLLPGLATMKVNTALGLVLSGILLAMAQRQPLARPAAAAFESLAALIAVLGALTLSQDLLGWNAGIDNLLIPDLYTDAASFPGRMSLASSAGFMITGSGLFLVHRRRARLAIDILTVALALLALVGLTGYLYHVRQLYEFRPFDTLALHTALSFLLLAVGIFCGRPEGGWITLIAADNLGAALARRLLPAAVLGPLVLGWLRLEGEHSGLYGNDIGTALFVAATVLLLGAAVLWSGRAITRIDRNRQLAHQAFLESEERFGAVANAAPILIWTAFPGGDRSYIANRAWIRFSGLEIDASPPASWAANLHPDDLDSCRQALARAQREHAPFTAEYRLRNGSGEYRWMLDTGTPRYAETGAFEGFIGCTLDVQERNQARITLARQASELRRANTELEEYAVVASHDLQEPLRQAQVFAQLLERRYRGRLDADADEFIRYLVHAVQRMRQLIADLVTHSHIAMQKEAVFEPVSAANAAEEALHRCQNLIEETGAVIHRTPLPVVNGNPAQIERLFQHLIANAITYRSAEAPEIHLTAEAAEDDTYVFAVQDNGVGIAPEYHQRIFGLFERLDAGSGQRTGIGLALCKRIVEGHGGKIWVRSAPGEGTTFYFSLPAAGAAFSAAGAP